MTSPQLRLLAAILACALAACQQQAESHGAAQRIDLADASGEIARIDLATAAETRELPMDTPDTTNAAWTVDQNGQSVHYGNPGEPALLSLECRLSEEPPQFAIIRHAPALPGQGALFAVMGNGHVSRLLADATLAPNDTGGEWRWEATLPADDPQLELFIGSGDMRATLPGKGALAIPPSPVPGQFVEWCRAGGQVMEAEQTESGSGPVPADPAPASARAG